MAPVPPGAYEDAPAIIALVLPLPFLALYISNRRVFPIAQREPWLVVIANCAWGFLVMSWMFEQAHPEMPIIEREFSVPICEWIVFGLYLVRGWKLVMEFGIQDERVKGTPGWFIRHRHYRDRPFLFKIMAFLFVVHFINIILALTENTDYLSPARASSKTNAAALFSVAYNFCYFISYVVLACKLAGKEDGLYLKQEMRLVGCFSGGLLTFWFFVVLTQMPCAVGSCSTLILWFSWLSMFLFSIIFPLCLAIRFDRRFSFTACFYVRSREGVESSTTRSQSLSDYDSREVEFNESHDEEAPAPKTVLSAEKIETYRRVPLSSYLTHPDGKESFRIFCVKEFSVENLLFVEAVAAYKARTPTKAEMTALYNLYVTDAAPNQVNLPAAVKQRMAARFSEVDGPDLLEFFDAAQEHVMKLMNRDIFRRYQKTADWVKYVVKFEVRGEKHVRTKSTEPKASTEPASIASEASSIEISTPNSLSPNASLAPETAAPVSSTGALVSTAGSAVAVTIAV